MLSKNKISYLQSLKQKKFRQKYNNFLVEGDKTVCELLLSSETKIEMIFALEEWVQKNEKILLLDADKVHIVNSIELKKISLLKTPNKVLAVVKQKNDAVNYEKVTKQISLYLDGIQDPGNMGTIQRIADWFGVEYVFCSNETVDIYNPKVIQSTMGAFLRVKTAYLSLEELKQNCGNIPVFGMLMNGKSIYDFDFPKSGIIVIGNEGKGISEENQALLSEQITIPAPLGSGAESLNAGVATGIVLSHVLK